MFSRIRKFFVTYKELKYLAYHDSLTGLLNRNWLYKNIDDISQKYVFFIDINDLTLINEGGHTCGDEHIKMVVREILKTFNDSDNKDNVLIRYAGDEFILFSNNKDTLTKLRKRSDLFTVGCCENSFENTYDSINLADMVMIGEKKRRKRCNL